MRCVPKLGQQGNPDSAGEFCWKGANVSVCFSCLGVVFCFPILARIKCCCLFLPAFEHCKAPSTSIHPQERLRYCNHLWNSLNISPDNGFFLPMCACEGMNAAAWCATHQYLFQVQPVTAEILPGDEKGSHESGYFDAGARHKEGLEETICREPQTSRCRQVGFWSWMRPPPSGNSWSRWNKPALGAMAHHAHLCLASKMRGKPWETGYIIYIYNKIHIVQ